MSSFYPIIWKFMFLVDSWNEMVENTHFPSIQYWLKNNIGKLMSQEAYFAIKYDKRNESWGAFHVLLFCGGQGRKNVCISAIV